MIENLDKYRLILASRSPRRQQLLRELGLRFDVVIKEYPEDYPENLSGEEIALYLAYEKARLFASEIVDDEIVITADTIVWCNNTVLGKPAGTEDAKQMLRAISGNTHDVITGVCILSVKKSRTFAVSTKVTFNELSEQEIAYYVDKFKPFDKAGAYGIQEWIGIAGCSRIEGSYFNVVGLPVQSLYRELQRFVAE
ncbi:MAG: septum formation protein Maf [Bacteroidales bacterium]|nr:septum formation protein Maf [Bacteroidales bacterium]